MTCSITQYVEMTYVISTYCGLTAGIFRSTITASRAAGETRDQRHAGKLTQVHDDRLPALGS